MTPTPASLEALSKLRVLNSEFGWYIITLLSIVLYIYSVEIKKAQETKDWSVVFAGLTLLGLDIFNETWNGLVFAFTNDSAFWTTPGASAYIILIGWNIEIAFMFSIAGIIFVKLLPEDKNKKIFGLPNRWAMAIGFTIFSVIVEILLNFGNYLIWEYPWWNWYNPILIFLFGYLYFYIGAFYVYDLPTTKAKIKVVGIIYAVDFILLSIFLPLGITGFINF
ncbi:MAG: hypothetical protein ACTSRH_12335 [Promethearchaeota archaeon]